jgi:hypothetical protein
MHGARIVLLALAASGAAAAQPAFGTLSPAARGESYMTMQLGFPEMGVAYGWGIGDDTDFGLRGDLYVALQSVAPHFDVQRPGDWGIGLGAHAPFRQRLARFGPVEAVVHADPGIKISPGRDGPPTYTCTDVRCFRPGAPTVAAFDMLAGLGLQLVLGRLRCAIAADADISSWSLDQQVLEPLAGTVVEVLLERGWFVGLDARAGLTLPRAGVYQAHDSTLSTPSDFAFRALLSFGWRGT